MMVLPALVGVGIRYTHHIFAWAVVAFISVQAGCYFLLLAIQPGPTQAGNTQEVPLVAGGTTAAVSI
jgi:hypothetical protein